MVSSSTPLCVAHISDCYAPRTGGIETQVGALVQQQVGAGLRVRVITATRGTGATDERSTSNPVIHRVVARIPGDLPIHPRTRHHVERLLHEFPVDVVHVHLGAVSPFAWGGIRAAHRLNLPILVTVHSMWGPVARLGYRVSDQLLHWSDWRLRMAAVSPVAAAAIADAMPGARPVLVLPNGIDPQLWRNPTKRGDNGGAEPGLRLVSVLRLAPRKRVLPLLRIVEAAGRRSGTRIHLAVIGDGPVRGRAERLARGMRHCQVTFTGRLDRSGIQEQFAQADLFVQPSIRESFGLAALEARTWGLPVIARSQSGSGAFITHGETGCLVASDQAMVEVLSDFATDMPGLRALQASTLDAPVGQTWPAILAGTMEAYRALLATSR